MQKNVHFIDYINNIFLFIKSIILKINYSTPLLGEEMKDLWVIWLKKL